MIMPRKVYTFRGRNRHGGFDLEIHASIEHALDRAHVLERFFAEHADAGGYSAALYDGDRRVWGIEMPAAAH